jgi:hypothetical protein
VKLALLMEFGRPLPEGAALAALVKALPVRHAGLRPMDEAISTAGGVGWDAVDEGLMLPCCRACSSRARCSTGRRRRAATC